MSEFGRLRGVDAGFLHQVIRHCVAGLLDFALHGFELQLGAVLQKLFKHFLRDGFTACLSALVLLHSELLEELDEFRLEVAAELYLVGGFVVLLAIRAHLHLHALRYLLEERLHIVGVHVVLFHVLAHIQVLPVLRGRFLVWNLGDDGVNAKGGFRSVFDGRLRVKHLSDDAPYLPCLLCVLLRRGQVLILLEAQPDKELDHRLTHGQFRDVRAVGQRVMLNLGVRIADAPILVLHAGVEARVLDDGVDVEGELAVVEEVEEALGIGEPGAFERFCINFGHFGGLRCHYFLAV